MCFYESFLLMNHSNDSQTQKWLVWNSLKTRPVWYKVLIYSVYSLSIECTYYLRHEVACKVDFHKQICSFGSCSVTQVLVFVAWCQSIEESSISDVPASEQHIRKQTAVSSRASGLNKLKSGPQMSFLFSQSQTLLWYPAVYVHFKLVH